MIEHARKASPASAVSVLDSGPEGSDPTFVREAHQLVLHYVGFVRRHRAVLIGVPFAAAVVALALTLSQPRIYEASVTMMAAGETPAPTYLPYLQNHSIADAVIRTFKLAAPPHSLTRSEFLQSAFRAEAIRNTNLLSMTVRLGDPQLVAQVLNRISKDAIELVRRTNVDNAVVMRDLLRVQLNEARTRLESATTRLLRYREQSQIELLRGDIDAALFERGQLLALSAQIEELRSRLTRAQTELQGRSRVDTMRRTIDDSPLLTEAARSAASSKGSTDASSVLGLQLRTDEVNKVYEALDERIAIDRAELAGLEQKRDQLVKADGLATPQMKKLSQLYSAESEIAALELEQSLREKVYSEVSNRYELARLDVAKHGELIVIDPALPPDRPLARGTVSNVLLGATAGLLLAVMIVVIGRAR